MDKHKFHFIHQFIIFREAISCREYAYTKTLKDYIKLLKGDVQHVLCWGGQLPLPYFN
jgi:hypothetical protein